MTTGYDLVDQVLGPWSAAHQLHVSTEFKDEPVRSIEMVGGNDSRVQIWIDPASADGAVSVHLWDYHDRRNELSGPVADLNSVLDAAYQLATEWLDETRESR